MPATTFDDAVRILDRMPAPRLADALKAIAASALDEHASSADLASTTYVALGELGIRVP